MHRQLIIAFFVLCQGLVGCATIITHQEHTAKSPTYIKFKNECRTYDEFGIKQQIHYSGTRFLVAWMNLPFACSGEECFGRLTYPLLLPLYLLDLPFSFIADTALSLDTYNIQYHECKKYDFNKLEKDRDSKIDLLFARRNILYENIYDLDVVMTMLSNDFMVFHKNSTLESSDKYELTSNATSCLGEDKARILTTSKNNPPTYFVDDWVYENNNWYLDAHTERNTDPHRGRHGELVDFCRF
ncbi:MAG: hypothetical protein HGA96_13020 [Desulfobulbaceae bacterium]|nr:hypothetical protein [Desulfobulbaceae bacterium]